MKKSPEYKSAKERLNRAKTVEHLDKLDVSFDRLYNAGVFTVNEYKRLAVAIMVKHAKINTN